MRKAAWQQLTADGFVPMLVGRQGRTASSAEDTELCLALRLAGKTRQPRLGLASASLVHDLAAGGMRGARAAAS